jgi:hypothetical protein
MDKSPSWEAKSHSVKKFPAFYGIRRLITVFTRACHWSLSWARCTHSTPSHTISLISILILSYNLSPGPPSGLFFLGFPTKILYAFVISHACYMYLSSHLPWFDRPNNVWRSVQVMMILIMQSSLASHYFLPKLQIFSLAPNCHLGFSGF